MANKEKTRLPKGQRYWTVNTRDMTAMVNSLLDLYEEYDNELFHSGNYFHTKEEAEVMARKIRAVIRGADVIEMPSGEDLINMLPDADAYDEFANGASLGWRELFQMD